MTIDGFIGGPHGEMDWMTWNWDEALVKYTQALTDSVDTIVLGRRLAEGFIPHWAGVAADAGNPEHAAGRKFTDTPKVVFSRTLDASHPAANGWTNTVVAGGGLAEEIHRLKGEEGKDLIAYGGAAFVSSLIKENLIDEYHLFVNPAAIGQGLSIFGQGGSRQELKLVKAHPFDCGIVVLHYEPKEA